MNLRNVGDSKFTVHHTILVEMRLHLKPTRFSGWVVHDMLRVSVLYDCCGKSEMILHIFEGVTQHHGLHAHVVVPCNNDDILTRKPTEML